MKNKTVYFNAILVFTISLLAFASGYLFHARQAENKPDFPVLREAYDLLERNGIKDLPSPPAIEYGMIRGMVQAYEDPYTVFIEPVQHELEGNTLQGSFGGIGARIERDSAGNYLLYPFPDGPADGVGIQDGARLIAVAGELLDEDTPADDILSAIRGPVGEALVLTIGNPPDYDPLDVRVIRAEIPLPSVTYHLSPDEPQIGILQVNIIAASTSDEIEKAVKTLQSRGAEMFILDLRGNPGGLLSSGVDIARLFLEKGAIIEQQYRGQEVETFRVERAGPLAQIPLAVLTNQNSASASEIIAGALKVHGRAALVGEPTFGKDSIQLVYDLSDGSSIHITAAKWWVPGLDPPIGVSGVQPDILVAPSDPSQPLSGPDPVLLAAQQALLKDAGD